jgi:hypothetical protein
VTQIQGWEYLGCGTDNVNDRAMSGAWEYNDDMSIESCIDWCSNKGFSLNTKYAPKAGIMGSCTKPCVGNYKQICGGANAMSIYRKCAAGEACKNNNIGGTAATQSKRAMSPRAQTTMSTVRGAAGSAAAPTAF